jgi:hypothetical protein
MNKVMDIDVLNKSSESKEEFYRKKINLLFSIVQKIGANPDVEFRKSLEFPKYNTSEKADSKIIDSQEARCVIYVRYLESIIQNNINSVDPLDQVELEIFERKNKDWEEYLKNIVSKSEDSEEEDSSNIPIIKKNRLGQIYRDE